MKRLAEIILWDRWGILITAEQIALVPLVILTVFFARWLITGKLLPWYYSRETTTAENSQRIKRVVNLLVYSVLAVAVLRILGIDYEFFSVFLEKSPTDDGNGVYFTVKISTIVTSVAAFVIASVIDLVFGEFLVQRLYAAKEQEKQVLSEREEKQLVRRFGAVRPIMYTLAMIVTAEVTGVAKYWFLRRPESLSVDATLLIDVEWMLLAVLLFFILRLVLTFFTTFILQRYYNKSKVDVGSQFAINRLLTYFAYIIGVLLVIQAAGYNLIAIWTGAAALLVGIGIGLQQTFNDLICGIIILFERSVKVGDVVELTGHQVGTIRKIGTRTSIVETRDDVMIYVPNSKLIGENVVNWSQVDRKARFHVKVGVAYGSDAGLVRDILIRVAKDHGRVLDNPGPTVRLLDFGDSSLDFDLLFWSRDLVRIEDIKSDLRFAIDSAFRKAKVEIPFPQRDLWIKNLPEGLFRDGKKEE